MAPQNIRGKYPVDTRQGTFLGYQSGTYKNIIWYDERTQRVKYGYHGRIDEGFNDLHRDQLPPNIRIFERHGVEIPADQVDTTVLRFETSANPFFKDSQVTVTNKCRSPTFGFRLATDQLLNRVFIQAIKDSKCSAASIAGTFRKATRFQGAYITDIADTPVFTMEDALAQFAALRKQKVKTFTMTLGLECKASTVLDRHRAAELEMTLSRLHI